MAENTTKLKPKASNKKKGKKLPWWIELFFVQIGLPETLLVRFLSIEKKTKLHLENNKSRYKLLSLIGILLIYFYPIINISRQKNNCINTTSERFMKDSNSKIAKAKAVNYCNGGNSSLNSLIN